MRKRLFAFFLALTVFLLGGCNLSLSRPSNHTTPAQVDGNKYIDEFKNNWQYRCLDEDNQKRYGVLYTALTDNFGNDEQVELSDHKGIGIQIPLSPPATDNEDVGVLYRAFFRDNPAFFYVGNTYEIAGYGVGEVAYYDTLLLSYTMDAPARAAAKADLDRTVQSYLADCPDTEEEYEIELYLHDRLTANCTYGIHAYSDGIESPHAYNAYGALVEGEAVCEGYARGMQLLLKQKGIASTLVTGNAVEDGESHMWNLVRINGEHYYLDATWDDGDDIPCHAFFNLTTAQLKRTHVLADTQLGIVDCTAVKDNYFIKTDTDIAGYDREDIARRIADRLAVGETTIELRFAPDKYDNGLLFLKNYSLTKSMVANHQKNGQMPLWEYTLYSHPEQYVLMLIKK